MEIVKFFVAGETKDGKLFAYPCKDWVDAVLTRDDLMEDETLSAKSICLCCSKH